MYVSVPPPGFAQVTCRSLLVHNELTMGRSISWSDIFHGYGYSIYPSLGIFLYFFRQPYFFRQEDHRDKSDRHKGP